MAPCSALVCLSSGLFAPGNIELQVGSGIPHLLLWGSDKAKAKLSGPEHETPSTNRAPTRSGCFFFSKQKALPTGHMLPRMAFKKPRNGFPTLRMLVVCQAASRGPIRKPAAFARRKGREISTSGFSQPRGLPSLHHGT